VGTVVGLTQFRIKRLLAYSTISHVGFMLLALTISSIESSQAFIFYLIQYSISNLNIFIILIVIGYTLKYFISNSKEYEVLIDKENSPVQLINQLRGFFYINPLLAVSLAITIFSFVGIPPLVGFFGKQMILSAALDKGYVFLSFVGIFTSVIGAVYYLSIIKEMFFYRPLYKIESSLNLYEKFLPFFSNISKYSNISMYSQGSNLISSYKPKTEYSEFDSTEGLAINSPMTFSIAILTLTILLFIFINKE
jgi:NADH-ubiquinone oxidoreductase chain 2